MFDTKNRAIPLGVVLIFMKFYGVGRFTVIDVIKN